MSFDFNDCKVFVSNIDSQSSANGGIVIQVLGEMSNKEGPWRKFAQTFFLAEQPNGYFVLNDIFRYLKDEEDTEQEAEAIDESIQEEVAEAEAAGRMIHHQVDITEALHRGSTSMLPATATGDDEAAVQQEPIGSHATHSANAQLDQHPAAAAPEPGAENAPPVAAEGTKSQDSAATTDVTDGVVELTSQQPSASSEEAAAAAPSAAANDSAAQPEAHSASPATKESVEPAPSEPAAVAPPKPSAPKTWAHLAASNVGKWATVASEGRTTSTPPKVATPETPRSAAVRAAPVPAATATRAPLVSSKGPHRGDDEASVFIKNVNADRVKSEALKKALSEFGAVLNIHTIPAKACAFADFGTAEHARKAVAASASRGGLTIDGWTVSVEDKRKGDARPGAGAGRGAGGTERGAHRGGAPSRGRGK